MRTSAALGHRRTCCWLSALRNLHLGIRAVQNYVTPIKLSTRKKRVQGSLKFGLTNFDTLLELIFNNRYIKILAVVFYDWPCKKTTNSKIFQNYIIYH